MPTLHVRLLGDFLLLADDVPITTFEMPRLQSLLAYLLLHHDAPQVRSHLAFVLWPDSTDAQAHANLRNILHHVRHALHALHTLHALPQADSYLYIERQTLQWKPSAAWTLDVLDFEHALSEAEQAQQARHCGGHLNMQWNSTAAICCPVVTMNGFCPSETACESNFSRLCNGSLAF